MFDWKPYISLLESEGYSAKVRGHNVLCVTHERFEEEMALGDEGMRVTVMRRQVQVLPRCLYFSVMDGRQKAVIYRKIEGVLEHIREFLSLPEGDMNVLKEFFVRTGKK